MSVNDYLKIAIILEKNRREGFSEGMDIIEKFIIEKREEEKATLIASNPSRDELLMLAADKIVQGEMVSAQLHTMLAVNDDLAMQLLKCGLTEIDDPQRWRKIENRAEVIADRAKIANEVSAHEEKKRSRATAKGGLAKTKNDKDGKQNAKAFVKERWNDWQSNPSRYKSIAAFARDMVNKELGLESEKVIAGWCTKWKEENSNPTK